MGVPVLRLLTILSLLYGALLVYASLMPFDFQTAAPSGPDIRSLWRGWPVDLDARISGSDLVSNLALYLPLGWMIAVRLSLSRRASGPFLSLLLSALVCSLLSFCIEAAQAVTLSRTASGSDWLLNTVSGTAGAALAGIYGTRLWMAGVSWLQNAWRSRPTDTATLALGVLMTADALTPFLPTILLKQVWRSLKHSHFDLSVGLAEHPWHWWLVTRVMMYAVLTLMLASWGRTDRSPRTLQRRIIAGSIAAGFAFGLETTKLLIASRAFNIANVAASWGGCLLGVLAGHGLAGRTSTRRTLEWAIAALLLYVFYLAWTPFHFVWDLERLPAQWPSPVQLLPLYHYAMGSELNHARLFVQSVFFQGLLIYLLRVRFGWFDRSRAGIGSAALAVGFLGLLQEGGQLFLPSRTPSATDIYCFALGGALGAWIPRSPAHRLQAETPLHPGGDRTAHGGRKPS